MTKLNFDELPDPGDRFELDTSSCLGTGVYGKVFSARDTENGNRKVAVKVQRLSKETAPLIQEEFRVFTELETHPNLPEFYGCFRKVGENDDEIWFIIELCEGGPVIDVINDLITKNRRMTEEHIAFILKEVVKALVYLHEHRIIHRDVHAANILLTNSGEVKLADFGLSRHLASTLGKSDTCIGSPCWMAPEVVTSDPVATQLEYDESGYGNRADVWALGITAIELGDGKAPFQDMHPTRAMFQIVRNPPPTLYRPGNWSDSFNDFINECLVKNPEHRPYSMEVFEHPFLMDVPENNYHLTQELKMLVENIIVENRSKRHSESVVHRQFLKKGRDSQPEKMLVEDLAGLDRLSEDGILQELQARMKQGQFQTFIGDVLLIINPNEKQNIYDNTYHDKYYLKSRSDNSPHIFAVAENAYQTALHHIAPQTIIFSGESGSGKTTNCRHALAHLLHTAENRAQVAGSHIMNAVRLIEAFTAAATPLNVEGSTRCVQRTEVTFGRTGKLSGAVLSVWQLDKWRVSSMDMTQSNYHMFYYFYDGMVNAGLADKYELNTNRQYRYLRIPDQISGNSPRDTPQANVKKFQEIEEIFTEFEFSPEQIDAIYFVLAAIINLGDVRFAQVDKGIAEVENVECAEKVAKLLGVDNKKFMWSLTNYCLINRGTALRRRHTGDEARDARDVLANTLYTRLVDYIVNYVNNKMAYGRTIFGEKYSVKLLDLFGFECFKRNHLPQLFVNCLNEQLHYHYSQRVFVWETLDMTEDEVPHSSAGHHYYDNKTALDQMLGKPEGVLSLVDDASKMGHDGQYIVDFISSQDKEHVKLVNGLEFSIAHFTGKVTYDSKEMADRNRDFLPPEVIETMRSSLNSIVKMFFANKLTRTGNLYTSFDENALKSKSKLKLSSSSDEDTLNKPTNEMQYSQIKKMRTAASTFRSLCLDMLKELSVGGGTGGGAGGMHFVKCARSDLEGTSRGFHVEIVRQQLRAMAVLETARARQRGYPYRVSFTEFLHRYKFLAFDFDETVEISRENCRLLLVRLKMEGWIIGKTKVFLKYYNEEYLARLYEVQVKKIVKIQSMMRGFLAKRKLAKKNNPQARSRALPIQKSVDGEMSEDGAARVLQKAYRGVATRKACKPLSSDEYKRLDPEALRFIRFFYKKWKAKSLFQVLLQYRAVRYHELFHLSQQVHIFNQSIVNQLNQINNNIGLECVDRKAQVNSWLGENRSAVMKLYFRLDEVPYFDTSYMCDPLTNLGVAMEKEESWDSPLRWRETVSSQITTSLLSNPSFQDEPLLLKSAKNPNLPKESPMQSLTVDKLIHLPYNRDPSEPILRLSSVILTPGESYSEERYGHQYPPPPPPPMNQQRNNFGDYSSNRNFDNNSKDYENTSRQFNNTSRQFDNSANRNFERTARTHNTSNSIQYNKSSNSSMNPVNELKTMMGRQNNDDGNEDDDSAAPFNFQGMLRKTNYQRNSIKQRSEELFRPPSLKKTRRFGDDGGYNSRTISTELAPGIYMEGVVSDL